jgi:hypothetical protein
MQLSLIRRGGFAGLRPPAFVVDLGSVPASAAQEFERLVAAARNDLPHLASQQTNQPDRFTYVLTIGGEGVCDEQYTFDELAATPAVMALVSAVQTTARSKGGLA